MKMYIDSGDLELLLERKRSYIGAPKTNAIEFVNAMLLLFSAYTTSIDDSRINQIIIKVSFCIFAIIGIAQIIWREHQTRSNNYTKDMLIQDIEALDMKERRSSIVAIKNPNNPRKYLVYYDPQWQYMLFPSYSTQNYENERRITECLSRDLATPESGIAVRFKNTGTEEKYATAHNEVRAYEYYFYAGSIDGLQDVDFEIDGRKYQWMTIDELMSDPQTKEHNRYIVEQVAKYF